MSYEDFLDLPVDYITQVANIIRFKREHNIPFSEEEEELVEHFVRYTESLKLKEDVMRLEYCYDLESYDKYK
jgi:hypothetical protein